MPSICEREVEARARDPPSPPTPGPGIGVAAGNLRGGDPRGLIPPACNPELPAREVPATKGASVGDP